MLIPMGDRWCRFLSANSVVPRLHDREERFSAGGGLRGTGASFCALIYGPCEGSNRR